MHSNHQEEREREIQALEEHFKNRSLWERLRDSQQYAWIITGRALEVKLVIGLGFCLGAIVATLLGYSSLTVWLAGVGVSFIAMVLHIKLRPNV